jgi:hypothetical protein
LAPDGTGQRCTVPEEEHAESSEEKPATGFPEPPGQDPGDRSHDPSPHHALNNPVGEPDPTEWPDPYEQREDPRDPGDPDRQPFGEQPHTSTGATSTSEPNPKQDPEAEPWAEGPKRDKVDE